MVKFIISFIVNIVYTTTFILFYFASVPQIAPQTFAQTSENYSLTTSQLHIPVSDNLTLLRIRDSSRVTKDTVVVKDYLSSTRAIINDKGETEQTLAYYPYGATHETWIMNHGSSTTQNSNNPKTAIQTQSGSAISDADPIAAIRSEAEDQTTDKLFTSHRKLNDLSVYHAGSRFYNPTLGLFIQPDKIEGINRYAYVGNNPVMFTDPSGNMRVNEGSYYQKENEVKINNLDLRLVKDRNAYMTSISATEAYDPDKIDRALMTDNQLFALYVLTGAVAAIPVIAVFGPPVIGAIGGVLSTAGVLYSESMYVLTSACINNPRLCAVTVTATEAVFPHEAGSIPRPAGVSLMAGRVIDHALDGVPGASSSLSEPARRIGPATGALSAIGKRISGMRYKSISIPAGNSYEYKTLKSLASDLGFTVEQGGYEDVLVDRLGTRICSFPKPHGKKTVSPGYYTRVMKEMFARASETIPGFVSEKKGNNWIWHLPTN